MLPLVGKVPRSANPMIWRIDPTNRRYRGGSLKSPATLEAKIVPKGSAKVKGINRTPASKPVMLYTSWNFCGIINMPIIVGPPKKMKFLKIEVRLTLVTNRWYLPLQKNPQHLAVSKTAPGKDWFSDTRLLTHVPLPEEERDPKDTGCRK